MPQPASTHPVANPGAPPPGVASGLDALYSRPASFRSSAEDSSAEGVVAVPTAPKSCTPSAEEAVASPPSMPTGDRKLLERLRNSQAAPLTIRVNGVELTLDVVDVDRTETSICCLVQQNGLRCKIPRSESVEIELDGSVHKTAFLGSWHTLDWLGVHVVVFPVLPDEEGG